MSSSLLSRCRGLCWWRLAVAALALALIVSGLIPLLAASRGLDVVETRAQGVPLTLYSPRGAEPSPLVVIAHGFAGSRQFMQPYALTLARNGYRVVTFDFPGHGRNRAPFVATLEDEEARLNALMSALVPAIETGLAETGSDGRLALLGHSMAGDVLVRYAASGAHPVAATVLVSPYLGEQAPLAGLANLLIIYGALEPAMLHEQGRALLAEASGVERIEAGETLGDPGAGSARRLVLAEGVEHIGVLYGAEGLEAARDWLDATFDHVSGAFVDRRGAALGRLYLGLVLLTWPLAALLPRLSAAPLGAGLGWRRLWPVAVAPALLTPLILWPLAHDLLPILLSDYLALHFGLYGLLTGAGLWWVGRRAGLRPFQGLWPQGRVRLMALATLAAALYATLAIALPAEFFVTTLVPGPERWGLVLAILAGTALYFAADEWLTRGLGAAPGAVLLTRLLFLLSLLFAVVLNLHELFFLVIIVPAILIFFLIYGLMSAWIAHRTRHPLVGALASALAVASAMAVTFPVVAG